MQMETGAEDSSLLRMQLYDGPDDSKLLRGGPTMQMQATSGVMIDGVRASPPPDIPSLMLSKRIIYVALPLVPQVTELIVAQLLYLSSENIGKDVQMYINCSGSAGPLEALAITDTMKYIKPDVSTVNVGEAYGDAALLLANGTKGKRVCLPNAQVALAQPGTQGMQGQASDLEINAREVLTLREKVLANLSASTGQSIEKLKADTSRFKFLNAEESIEYGIVDKIVGQMDLPEKPAFLLVGKS